MSLYLRIPEHFEVITFITFFFLACWQGVVEIILPNRNLKIHNRLQQCPGSKTNPVIRHKANARRKGRIISTLSIPQNMLAACFMLFFSSLILRP
jgi:hypothetical protein